MYLYIYTHITIHNWIFIILWLVPLRYLLTRTMSFINPNYMRFSYQLEFDNTGTSAWNSTVTVEARLLSSFLFLAKWSFIQTRNKLSITQPSLKNRGREWALITTKNKALVGSKLGQKCVIGILFVYLLTQQKLQELKDKFSIFESKHNVSIFQGLLSLSPFSVSKQILESPPLRSSGNFLFWLILESKGQKKAPIKMWALYIKT